MQFVTRGPDIPERLLQAHEEGRVVFFCGAGISYPARLPGFSGLVDRIYAEIGDSPDPLEKAAIKSKQFDTAIGLLEARCAPRGQGRGSVRQAVARILTPTEVTPRNTSTHSALLTLARCRSGHVRLVTTNFDRLFEEVICRESIGIERFNAPLLPVPKSRWNGIVALHGLLTSDPTSNDLNRLVLSSGDFGLAYLTERWAARFVAELFRNYSVCFVGYSINDPILRYMMDALAADRLLGESSPEMFAFGSYSQGQERQRDAEWRAKSVTPILYRETTTHIYLHRTLNAWASTYRDGASGKEQIIARFAQLPPQVSTDEENFVGRVLWAMSDAKGLPAKRFAELVPAPPFDWLEVFTDRRFTHEDYIRFGLPPLPSDEVERRERENSADALKFSLLQRPALSPHSPCMAVVSHGHDESVPDQVMNHLSNWLLHYLDEPKLLIWLSSQGGYLSANFARLVEHRLDEIFKWERAGEIDLLNQLKSRSPKAIPRPPLRTVWRLMLTHRIRPSSSGFEPLYQWSDRVERDGLTASLRMELCELLAPRISLRAPFSLDSQEDSRERSTETTRLKDLVEWDLVLSCQHVHWVLKNRQGRRWAEGLPSLLEDATRLLKDAFDLRAELGDANPRNDFSCILHPSISEHPQNRDFYDWTALIDLTRDAWIATANVDAESALHMAQRWWKIDYPLFRRLCFFAATDHAVIPTELAITWLHDDNGWWIWSAETQREVIRLLVSLAPRLDVHQMNVLEQAILTGAPRDLFKEDTDEIKLSRMMEREIWLRLGKMKEAGAQLGPEASRLLDELSMKHPAWRLALDEQDEFPFWIGEGDDMFATKVTPRGRRQLVRWLKDHPREDAWDGDDWAGRCRVDFPATSCALYSLAQENQWPIERWKSALQAWSENKLVVRSWRYHAPFVCTMSADALTKLAHQVGWWLKEVAKIIDRHQMTFFELCKRMLDLDHPEDEETDDPVFQAINHPIGHVTRALLDWWLRSKPKNSQGLPEEIKNVFTLLCDLRRPIFRHGRVVLATNLITLFLVDPEWTKRSLLPLFKWDRPRREANLVWQGFMCSPRLVRSHLAEIKPHLLETARHCVELGEHAKQFVSFLTFAALDTGDTFTTAELRDAFKSLPDDLLPEASSALTRIMIGPPEHRESSWKSRVVPFWKTIWPKTTVESPEIAEDLFDVCISAGKWFPEALDLLKPWLVPVHHPDQLIKKMIESNLHKEHPVHCLELLGLLINTETWVPRNLESCLNVIADSSAVMINDPLYIRLNEFIRRFK